MTFLWRSLLMAWGGAIPLSLLWLPVSATPAAPSLAESADSNYPAKSVQAADPQGVSSVLISSDWGLSDLISSDDTPLRVDSIESVNASPEFSIDSGTQLAEVHSLPDVPIEVSDLADVEDDIQGDLDDLDDELDDIESDRLDGVDDEFEGIDDPIDESDLEDDIDDSLGELDSDLDEADEIDEDLGETEDELGDAGDEQDDATTADSDEADDLEFQTLLIEGDRLFLQGSFAEADQLYRQAKAPDDDVEATNTDERPQPITDPEQLAPAGQVYWREVQRGMETGLETRIEVPLELLSSEYPEFIPGQIAYAQYMMESDRPEEALATLERAASLYPDEPQVVQARVELLAANEQWLEAAIAARQYALLNADAPQAADFTARADEYENRFQSRMRGRLIRRTVGNVLAGAAGFVLTGNPFGPLAALETTIAMARGETAIGESIANRAIRELDMIRDEEVVSYVRDIGNEIAQLAGRDEFNYQFYVVEDEDLNAFALPGGKIFINAGAILETETGAELAGLLAHEISHAVLSHGFQLMTGGNLTANVLQFIPYGGFAANLAVLRYSRGMERQADALGTQILANSRYAADGLLRLTQTLYEENGGSTFEPLSTHPDTPERIRNLETLIEQNGYDRYAFEGIERHLEIRERVREIMGESEDKIDTTLDETDSSSEDTDTPEPVDEAVD
ncbi:MAG: M48 family metalloprotease [Elainellaceae cyanobacterium]